MEPNSSDQNAEPMYLLKASQDFETEIKLKVLDSTTIEVRYDTLSANQPQTYGNRLFLWQNANPTIPWAVTALQEQAISSNTPNGSTIFEGLNLANNSYIIGYSVGSQLLPPAQPYGNICATGFIRNLEATPIYFSTSLTVVSVGPNSVAISYEMPAGIMPQTNKAWMALWLGEYANYTNPPAPLTIRPLTNDLNTGVVAFNGINLRHGQSYTAALFNSGYNSAGGSVQTSMAAYVVFKG